MLKADAEKLTQLFTYQNLVKGFLKDEIDSKSFEESYFSAFKNDSNIWLDEEFEVLNKLFTDLDAFCSDETLLDEKDLNKEQLRNECKKSLVRLNTLIEKYP